MTEYKYAILCEDIAHSKFVAHILPALVQAYKPAISIVEDLTFPVMAYNDDQVVRKCSDACRKAFIMHNVHIFVVCRDVDSVEVEKYNLKEDELKQKLPERWKERIILCLPVQYVEHWLLYFKQRKNNPDTTKNEPVENIPGKEAKKQMYGEVSTRKEARAAIVEEHCTDADVSWLLERSASFQKFAANVESVIRHLTAANN